MTTQPFISYEKDLPEIANRLPWEKPIKHLVKDETSPTGWSESIGRRESKLLLVEKIRSNVNDWRDQGYPGASEVTLRLLEFWFEEEHEIPGFSVPFRYHFCQREAIETLMWLIDVAEQTDTKAMIESFATTYQADLFNENIVFQTTMEGRRQIRRHIPEIGREGVQDLPPEDLRRFAFKMATGSGKTWVMAMAIVWSYFHSKNVQGSPLSTNFLLVAPNVIVYQRLEKDFANNRIFHEIPLIPPEWRQQFSQNVILRGDSSEAEPSGNLFLTNIQQLYESREDDWTPKNAIEVLLGRKPPRNLVESEHRSMLERIKSLKSLVVLNDEAHHVHDERLAWSQSLLSIHNSLPNGIGVWLDYSATPKDQNGMYFPWTICDYPLAQAVEDRIIKAPIIVSQEDDSRQPAHDPDHVTKDNVTEKYSYWIQAAVERWREHRDVFEKVDRRSILFIMVEKNVYANAIGDYLWKTEEFGFKENEILVIHTDATGNVSKKDLTRARETARDIDQPNNPIKAIVSVMMLREGWDVRNVSVVLGLRPFTAKSEILPEQVIGRGLRLMSGVSPDRTQTLEVLGTRNLLRVLYEQLEAEGVGVITTKTVPDPPVTITPIQGRLEFDIAIPLTKLSLTHNILKLSELDPNKLEPIYSQNELSEPFRIRLRMEFATTATEVHHTVIGTGDLPPSHQLISSITNKAIDRAKLPNHFAQIYPITKSYVAGRCFGREINLEEDFIRDHLSRLELQEGIAKYLAREISTLTLERLPIEFENEDFQLSQTKPFLWRRNLPPLVSDKTVFNFVATYNNYERRFAEFLDHAADVLRFGALGTTEQGDSGASFRIGYLKPSGAIGLYHPDWVVVQQTNDGEVNWIIETKGRVWDGTEAKDAAMTDWCRRLTLGYDREWRYARVNQTEFDATVPTLLSDVVTEPLSLGI